MLKFFRTIRKKLIEEDNVRKYLLYAIGEILLVVIGILIALQVNNWNEGRKELKLRDTYTQSLLRDLAADTTDFNRWKAYVELDLSRIDDIEQRLRSDNATIDTLKNIVRYEFVAEFDARFNFNDATILSLQNTGDIGLYPAGIREKILELKKNQENYFQVSNIGTQFYADSYQNLLKLVPRPDSDRSFRLNDEFVSKSWEEVGETELTVGFDNVMNNKLIILKGMLQYRMELLNQTEELIELLMVLD